MLAEDLAWLEEVGLVTPKALPSAPSRRARSPFGGTKDRSGARGRVLAALRAAGSRGVRTDVLREVASCSHVGGRVHDLVERGFTIDTLDDPDGTDFAVYVLRSEPLHEVEPEVREIRLRLPVPVSRARADELRAALAAHLVGLLDDEDGADVAPSTEDDDEVDPLDGWLARLGA